MNSKTVKPKNKTTTNDGLFSKGLDMRSYIHDLRYWQARVATWETVLNDAENRVADLRSCPRHIHESAELIAEAASDAATARAELRHLRQKIANIKAVVAKSVRKNAAE